MKKYGAYSATEFTKKQINVIFAKAKKGELKVEKWFLSELYDLAEYYGYDDNKGVERDEIYIKKIIQHVFDGKLEEAQSEIDFLEKSMFDCFTEKRKAKCDRNFVV